MTRTAVRPAPSTVLESSTSTGVHWRMGGPVGLGASPTETAPTAPRTPAVPAEELRRARATARDWVRELVTSRLGLHWAGFEESPAGRKPRPRGLPGVDVSISHSGGTLLVAVVRGGRLGVDVEDEPFDAFDHPSLVRRMCAASEHDRIASLPASSRRRALAQAWTAKEAALKALGVGLAIDPRRIVVPAELASGRGSGPERTIVHLTAGEAHVFRPGAPGDDETPSVWRGFHVDWSG